MDVYTNLVSGSYSEPSTNWYSYSMTVERRRLRESAAAADKSLRDERKAVEAQKQRADALQERVTQLQQKLDALSEIEKSLSERQAKGR